MSDSNLFLMLRPHGWEKEEEAKVGKSNMLDWSHKDAIYETLFEKEKIANSPLTVPTFTANDNEKGFGFAYPKASELKQFGVPESILHTRAKENLQAIQPRPEVSKPSQGKPNTNSGSLLNPLQATKCWPSIQKHPLSLNILLMKR